MSDVLSTDETDVTSDLEERDSGVVSSNVTITMPQATQVYSTEGSASATDPNSDQASFISKAANFVKNNAVNLVIGITIGFALSYVLKGVTRV